MNLITQFKTNAVVRNSAVMFLGAMIFNVLNYVYHLVMSRLLSVGEFGELESLFSIIYLVIVPATALMTIAMKYGAIYKAENAPAKAAIFLKKFDRRLLTIALAILALAILGSPLIAQFLKLSSLWPVPILGLLIISSLFAYLRQGLLQGWQKFRGVSAAMIVQGVLKIGLAAFLVWLSWGVAGAVGGVMLGTFIFYLLTVYLLKFLPKQKDVGSDDIIDSRQILRYSWPVFITLLAVTALYSLDMMLVKHYFDAETAGNYGALAVLGKIIFFATAPLIGVMFPMVAERHHLKNDYRRVFKQSFRLVFLVGLTPVFLYFLFPRLIIILLVGAKFLVMAPYLGWLGAAIFLVGLINFFANFFLSIQKTNFIYFILAGVLAQVILIVFFHQTLWQVIWVLNGVFAGILFLLLGYFWRLKNV